MIYECAKKLEIITHFSIAGYICSSVLFIGKKLTKIEPL